MKGGGDVEWTVRLIVKLRVLFFLVAKIKSLIHQTRMVGLHEGSRGTWRWAGRPQLSILLRVDECLKWSSRQ